SQTGWPRILQRRLRAWLSLCTARTYSPHPDAPSHLCRKHHSPLPRLRTRDPSGGRSLSRPASALRHEGLTATPDKTAICRTGQKSLQKLSPARRLIQRSGQYLLCLAVMQTQNAITAASELKVMGDDEGREPVVSMEFLNQSKHHFRGPVVQITG